MDGVRGMSRGEKARRIWIREELSLCLDPRRKIWRSLGEIGGSYSSWIMLRMDFGMKMGLTLSFRAGSLDL